MNTLRVVVLAQVIVALSGLLASLLIGPGYVAAIVDLTGAILILITLNRVHSPAIATSLAFAFVPVKERTLLLFFASLIMLAGLMIVQRLALWSYHRMLADDS